MFCYYMCYDMYKIASPTLFLPLNKPPMISNKQLCLGGVFTGKRVFFVICRCFGRQANKAITYYGVIFERHVLLPMELGEKRKRRTSPLIIYVLPMKLFFHNNHIWREKRRIPNIPIIGYMWLAFLIPASHTYIWAFIS